MEKWQSTFVQHKEHREWIRKLDFYQSEIDIFLGKLLLVAEAHPYDFKRLEHIDEYRGILAKKQQKLKDFHQLVAEHEHQLMKEERGDFVTHNDLRKKMEVFEEEYHRFKSNFRRFVSHND